VTENGSLAITSEPQRNPNAFVVGAFRRNFPSYVDFCSNRILIDIALKRAFQNFGALQKNANFPAVSIFFVAGKQKVQKLITHN
jgi:hypothetical protein